MDPKKRSRGLGDAIENLAEEAVEAAEELDQRRGGGRGGDSDSDRGRGDANDEQERGGNDEDQGRGERGRG